MKYGDVKIIVRHWRKIFDDMGASDRQAIRAILCLTEKLQEAEEEIKGLNFRLDEYQRRYWETIAAHIAKEGIGAIRRNMDGTWQVVSLKTFRVYVKDTLLAAVEEMRNEEGGQP